MMLRIGIQFFFMLLLISIGVSSAAGAADADLNSVAGKWKPPMMDAVIAIGRCEDGLCAELVEHDYTSVMETDINDPVEEMRQRPLVGVRILEGLRKVGERKWTGGFLYDPRTGRTYMSKLKLIDENRLKIIGCIGPGLCNGYVWTRAES